MWAYAQRDGRPPNVCWGARSQPLMGGSSPYWEDKWRRYGCLTSFFPIVNTCHSCEDIDNKFVRWCALCRWRIFASCIFSEPHAAHFRTAF